ncbi:MAG: VTT domain-containing protein [Roseobacter sp.]|jgi:uncharacterized membrane protein YdjX (TVP38/TMEM64 family)
MADMTRIPKSRWTRRLPLLIVLATALIGAIFLKDYFSFETLRDNRERLLAFRNDNLILTIFAFCAAYVTIVAFSLPGALMATLTGGFLFGTLGGSFLSVLGATTGATLIFLAARHGFGDQLKARLDASDGKVGKISRGIDENQWSMLFVMRLVPIVPFFVANLVPAFLAVPLHRYVVSTFLGIIPGSLVYASVGAGLGEVFALGATPDLSVIFEPQFLLPLLGLALLSLMPVFVKAVSGKNQL